MSVLKSAPTVSVHSLPLIMAEAKERQKAAGIERASGERNEHGQLVQKVAQASNEPTVEESKRSREVAAELTGTNPEYVFI